jgi:hypothetical protein
MKRPNQHHNPRQRVLPCCLDPTISHPVLHAPVCTMLLPLAPDWDQEAARFALSIDQKLFCQQSPRSVPTMTPPTPPIFHNKNC